MKNRIFCDFIKADATILAGIGCIGAAEAAVVTAASTVALPATLCVVGTSLVGCAVYQAVKTPVRAIREGFFNKKGEIYIIFSPIPQYWFLASLPNSLVTDFVANTARVKLFHAALRVYTSDKGDYVEFEIGF